jgi:holo-[acyl-carrier protein] synthase
MDNVIAHGVDMVDCDRLRASIERFGPRFLDRVFTPDEQKYCKTRKKNEVQSLAGRFAVKEAVLKVIGTGWRDGIAWTDIEVRNEPSGQPIAHLHGRCRQIAEEQGIGRVLVSISHIKTHAIASAIGVSDGLAGAER